ncbi:hypothetical protein Tco_1012124, partial [Tanacetum coccineum]
LSAIFLFLWVSGGWREKGPLYRFSFVVLPASFILIDCATVVGLVGSVAVFQEDKDARFGLFLLLLVFVLPLVVQLQQELKSMGSGIYRVAHWGQFRIVFKGICSWSFYFSSLDIKVLQIMKLRSFLRFKGWLFTMHVILELQISLLQELSRAADSYDITDQLSMLFRREVVEDSQRIHEYRRLCDELTECVRMRDEYMNELRMLDNSEEILEY